LSYACKNGQTELALRLLEKGAYVNIPNKVKILIKKFKYEFEFKRKKIIYFIYLER
jgi:hypothetical protein